jgi:hypothetical protein
MPEEQRKDQVHDRGGSGGGGGGGNNAQRRSTKKPLLDSSNIAGAFVWMISALLTCVAAANTLIAVPAGCRAEDLMILPVCQGQVVGLASVWYFIGALIFQLIISIAIRNVPDLAVQRISNYVNWLINFFGLYWLVCVKLELLPGLRDVVKSIVKMNTGTLLGTSIIILLSIGLEWYANKLFNKSASGQGQRR